MRHILSNCAVAAWMILSAAAAYAETHRGSTKEPAKTEQAESQSEMSKSEQALDRLFAQLGRETKPAKASATARKIWREWTRSGSSTVDLLMNWAAKAMAEKKYAAAQDLLDQVVVLAPGYAEGWNRRATLYYTMSEFGRSISDIKQTLALEPRHFGALSGLAAILQQLEREEEALQTWYRVLEIYPANKPAQDAVVSLEEKLSGNRI